MKDFYIVKILKSHSDFCGQKTAVSIDGVAKMPLQASIFTPGKIMKDFYLAKILKKPFGFSRSKDRSVN